MVFATLIVLLICLYLYSVWFLDAPIGGPIRTGLTFCRLIVLGSLLFLLTLPQIREIIQRTIPPSVYIVLDDSASMSFPIRAGAGLDADEPETRWEYLQRKFTQERYISRLEDRGFPVRVGLLSALSTRPAGEAWGASFPQGAIPVAPYTNLAEAVRKFDDHLAEEESGFLLLFSDGQWNRGGDPVDVVETVTARRLSAPAQVERRVYAFGIGPHEALFDIAVGRVELPSMARVSEPVEVRVHVVMQGAGPLSPFSVQARIVDEEGGEAGVLEEIITPEADETSWTATFQLPELDAGTYIIQGEIPMLSGELTDANNRFERGLRVESVQDPILLLTSGPDWEYRFFKRVLEDEESLDVQAYLSHENGLSPLGDRRWIAELLGESVEDPFPTFATLEEIIDSNQDWSAIVLHNFVFSPERVEFARWIRRYVENGGGLMWLPGNRNETPLPPALISVLPPPLAPPVNTRYESSLIRPDSAVIPTMAAALQRIPERSLPPLTPLRLPESRFAAARPLLKGEIPGSGVEIDLLSEHRFGLGTIVASGAGGFWRLRMLTGEEILRPFWLSALYQCNPQLQIKAGEITTDRYFYEIFEPVTISYRTADTILEATQSGQSVQVSGPTRTDNVWLTPSEEDSSIYTGRFTPPTPGAYSVADLVGESTAAFRAGVNPIETSDLRQNVEGLLRIAQRGAGEYADAPDWTPLIDSLPHAIRVIEEERMRFLGERWWVALFLIFFLGMEWFIRWRQGLP